jgi:O-antigen/teichoic acid export membrane protein
MPLSASNIIDSIQVQFYGFILPIFVLPDIIGNYGIANTFVVLIGFFATPITTVLFPAFSKLDPQEDREALKNVYQFSIKYASLFVVPVAAITMTLSQPGISVLFPQYSAAPLFLALLAITYLYTPFGMLSNANLINSQGQTKFILKLTLINAALGFPLSIVLISQFGVIGLIITILTIGWPSRIIGLRWLKKQYGVAPDWASSAKILLSSATASTVTYTIVSIAPFSIWIRLIIGALVFMGVLIIATLLSRTIDRTDINNLRGMLADLGPFRRLFNFLLNIIEKLMTYLQP